MSFQALPDEIAACHSFLGGEFGERIDVVKDAKHRLRREPLPAACDGRSAERPLARVLDNIESTSPIMAAAE
ncbi:MAG: hypothetical protein ACREDV_09635 [Methylocella sp.]